MQQLVIDVNVVAFVKIEPPRFRSYFDHGDLLLLGRTQVSFETQWLYGTFLSNEFHVVSLVGAGDRCALKGLGAEEQSATIPKRDVNDALIALCGWWKGSASSDQKLWLPGFVSRSDLVVRSPNQSNR